MKKTEFSRAKSEQCAKDVIDFLIKEGMWGDVHVYAHGKVWCNRDNSGHYHYDQSWDSVFFGGEDSPDRYVTWCSDFLTITFEGMLYEALNFMMGTKTYDRIAGGLNDILGKYDKYFELGHSWSLAAYDRW